MLEIFTSLRMLLLQLEELAAAEEDDDDDDEVVVVVLLLPLLVVLWLKLPIIVDLASKGRVSMTPIIVSAGPTISSSSRLIFVVAVVDRVVEMSGVVPPRRCDLISSTRVST